MSLYQFSPQALSDIQGILEYTFQNFGKNQMIKYQTQLDQCIKQLSNDLAPYRKIDVDGITICSLHCQKHYIFAQKQKNKPLLIIGVLHEKMDLLNQLKNRI